MEIPIIDFHIPSRVVPHELLYFPDHGLYVFPSTESCTLMSQIRDLPSLGVVLTFDGEVPSPETISTRLNDLATILAMAFPDPGAFQWLANEWLAVHQSTKDPKTVSNPAELAAGLTRKVTPDREPGPFQIIADFEGFVVPQIAKDGLTVNLASAIDAYLHLPPDSHTKHLIKTFSFAICSGSLLNRIYNNQNLQLSLLWTVVDALMPTGTTSRDVKCPKCKATYPINASIGDAKRIEDWLDTQPLHTNDKALMATFLGKLKGDIRSRFYHAGKIDTASDKLHESVKILGKNSSTFQEDIEKAEGRFSGVHILEMLLRRHFFDELGAVCPSEV